MIACCRKVTLTKNKTIKKKQKKNKQTKKTTTMVPTNNIKKLTSFAKYHIKSRFSS